MMSSQCSNIQGFHGEVYTGELHKTAPDKVSTSWPGKYLVIKQVPCDAHAQCFKWSQLLHKHYLQNMEQEREAVEID